MPERFADRVPPLLVEIAIGTASPILVTLMRMALTVWTSDRAPYSLVFVAVIAAAALAGWRSGLLALVLGQLMAWYLIVDPGSYATQKTPYIGGFIVSTLAQLMILAIIALYQREVDRAWSQREEQVDLIHHALDEMDHRTTNNYQTVLALVLAQARRADEPVKQALEQVADRINAIAMASKHLAVGSGSIDQVRISQHLGGLCGELKRGLARPGVTLQCHFDDIQLGADETTWVSIVVNELVTNALKHAFPDDRRGAIRVSLRKSAGGLELEVADDGVGMRQDAASRGTGVGTRLVETFVKQLAAHHEVETGETGTRHRIQIPLDR